MLNLGYLSGLPEGSTSVAVSVPMEYMLRPVCADQARV